VTPSLSRYGSRPAVLARDGAGWYPSGMDIIDTDSIDRALRDLDGWRREGDTIVRELRFPSFMDAIRFIDRVAVVAEAADHHPELTNVYWNVSVRLTTHDAGGVTERDLALARAIDAVVRTPAG
jgi:4a-hydroxytetrahydrobiopterin dehydratase